MAVRHILAILAGTLFAVSCGGEPGGKQPSEPVADPWVNEPPLLQIASPGEMAVGDKMMVLGQRFIDAVHGKVYLQFKGTYFDSQGGSNPVDLQVSPKVNTTETGVVKNLSWEMYPNIVFHPNGDQLGRFVGHLIAMNAGNDGSQEFSEPLPITIDVKPSIIARMVRPLETSCGVPIHDTLEGIGMAFAVEAVGLRTGTAENPLTFTWGFLAEQWKVAFDYGLADPNSLLPKTGGFMLQDEVKDGTVSTMQDGGSRNFILKIGSDLLTATGFTDARLRELKTAQITPDEATSMPVSVNVTAMDASGSSATLSMRLVIHRQAELVNHNETRIAERFAPTRVSDCMPGDAFGVDVTYHEGTSESRARSLGFSWNLSAGLNVSPLGLPPLSWIASIAANPQAVFGLGINFSAGFGMNVNEQVSSDTSKSLSLSGHILPGTWGVFYRQTTKLYHVAKLVAYNECGESFPLGDAILTDWLFTPELATGGECVPPSLLPPAEKFE